MSFAVRGCAAEGHKGHEASQTVSTPRGSPVLGVVPPDVKLGPRVPLSVSDQDHPSTRRHHLWDGGDMDRRLV